MKQAKTKINVINLEHLKYGENPSQLAVIEPIPVPDHWSLEKFVQVAGDRDSSYVNLTDHDRILTTMRFCVAALRHNGDWHAPYAVALAVKHGNCCGAAYSTSQIEALRGMILGDKQSIFGGVVMLNFYCDEHVARELLYYPDEKRRTLDVVIASGFSPKAIELLARKEGKCRMFANPALAALHGNTLSTMPIIRHIHGAKLAQDPPSFILDFKKLKPKRVGPAVPASTKLDLAFAAAICTTSNSNTIILVKDRMLIGQGIGQTSRVGAVEIAIFNAQRYGHAAKLEGAVAVSDSYFPFLDGPRTLKEFGIKAVFTPTGSTNDKSVLEYCRSSGMTLYHLPHKESRMFFGH
jgi:phosphoribosylaminoimidazolecarboxamide formyltransferase / IMP cyclohydrolase